MRRLLLRDPFAAIVHVTRGYHASFPLEEREIAVLFPLILTRLAVSVTNSAYMASVRPGDHYVTVSEKYAWEAAENAFRDSSAPGALPFARRLRSACGPACGRDYRCGAQFENRARRSIPARPSFSI